MLSACGKRNTVLSRLCWRKPPRSPSRSSTTPRHDPPIRFFYSTRLPLLRVLEVLSVTERSHFREARHQPRPGSPRPDDRAYGPSRNANPVLVCLWKQGGLGQSLFG